MTSAGILFDKVQFYEFLHFVLPPRIWFAENFYTVRNKFVTVYKFIFIGKEIYGQPYIVFQAPFMPSFTYAPLSVTSSPPFLLNGYFIFLSRAAIQDCRSGERYINI